MVDESVGTFALPISALLIVVVFGWVADLPSVRDDLDGLYPVARYLIPVVLVVITVARGVGVTGPAWRLLSGTVRTDPWGLLLAGVVLGAIAAVGWRLRDRIRVPPRLRRTRQ